MRYFIALFIATCGISAQAGGLGGILNNNDGVALFKKERFNESYSKFTQGLAELPFSPQVHFNLANSYLANKEYEKALQEYKEVIRLAPQSPQMKFAALFNSAHAATELKQIDQALAYYQDCLAISPDSLQVKTNIELLTQGQGGGGQKNDQDKKDNKDQNQSKSDQNKDKDNKGDQQKQQQPKDQSANQPKPQPKPFNSQELSQQDVNRIMEEIKRQEEQVRAQFQNKKVRDTQLEKDW